MNEFRMEKGKRTLPLCICRNNNWCDGLHPGMVESVSGGFKRHGLLVKSPGIPSAV